MGVKEYRFLTKTMKTITTRSNKLEKANRLLAETVDDPKDWKLSSTKADIWDVRWKIMTEEKILQSLGEDKGPLIKEINATKKEVEAKKAEIPIYIPNVYDKYWGSRMITGSLFLLWIFFSIIEFLISPSDNEYWTYSVLAMITTFLIQRKRGEIGLEKYLVIDGLESKINDLNNRVRTLKKEKKNRNKINSKLSELRKELSELESGIKGSNKLRDSTEREIKLLEKEIVQLWESIAHLIPFSTALEKA